MAQEKSKSYLTGISHSVASVMAGSIHTLLCCMSKPRSSLEAGKKQPRVWLQYGCSVTEMFLDGPSGRAERLNPSFSAPLVFLWYFFGDCEMVRNGLEGRSECSVLTNMDENDYEVGFMDSRIYVRKPMNPCFSSTHLTIVRI